MFYFQLGHDSTVVRATCAKRSHIAVAALDGLADHRGRDLIRDLDVPHFAFALGGEVGEQLRDCRHIAYLVAAQAEAACDVFEPGRPNTARLSSRPSARSLLNSEPYPPSFIAQIRMRYP